MKNKIIGGMVAIAAVLSGPKTAHAQGTIYLSSLGQPSAGSQSVASDSWQATMIQTGNNPGGYALDSVQLAMMPGSGAPNGFTVMLYSANMAAPGDIPDTSLGTLSGSTDPVAGGMFTYTASDIMLSPSTGYYIVLTAATPLASGAYAWTSANSFPSSSDGWSGSYFTIESSNASTWTATFSDPEFALTATAVPEPDTLALLGVAGWIFFVWRRWHTKTQLSIAR